MKKQLHNMLIWAVTAEVIIIEAICLLIGALTGGRTVVHMFIVIGICSWWIAMFIQVNADNFDRAIDRSIRRIRKGIRRLAARRSQGSRKGTERDFVIVTFPTSEYHMREGNTNVKTVRAGRNHAHRSKHSA